MVRGKGQKTKQDHRRYGKHTVTSVTRYALFI